MVQVASIDLDTLVSSLISYGKRDFYSRAENDLD